MGERLRPPYSGKFYITDRDGRQVELEADFVSEINVSREIEPASISVLELENAMKVFSRASQKLSLSMTIIGDVIASLTENDKDTTPLPDDAWEKMILNGIHD